MWWDTKAESTASLPVGLHFDIDTTDEEADAGGVADDAVHDEDVTFGSEYDSDDDDNDEYKPSWSGSGGHGAKWSP
jgi:hypothetical protein